MTYDSHGVNLIRVFLCLLVRINGSFGELANE